MATPVVVHVIDSPAAKDAFGHGTEPLGLSATVTPLSGTLPVLVTTYVHVTVLPTGTVGPGALSASCPLVAFLMRTDAPVG